jgi:hypothetical protein
LGAAQLFSTWLRHRGAHGARFLDVFATRVFVFPPVFIVVGFLAAFRGVDARAFGMSVWQHKISSRPYRLAASLTPSFVTASAKYAAWMAAMMSTTVVRIIRSFRWKKCSAGLPDC